MAASAKTLKTRLYTRLFFIAGLLALISLCASCIPTYKLNGASVDYTKTKTISFERFPIKASLVYSPLEIRFNDELQAKFANQTRLEQVRKDGDMQLSGAITGYGIAGQAVKNGDYASLTRLTIRIKVKFVNKANSSENFEKEFSASREFEATRMLTEVQDGLCQEMVDELVEEIFNATVANW